MNHERLGDWRRNCRDYAVHQRAAGMTAGDRMDEQLLFLVGSVMLICAIALGGISIAADNLTMGTVLFIVSLSILGAACSMRIPRLLAVPAYVRHRIGFNTFNNDAEFYQLFGFTIDDAFMVYEAMQVPAYFTINRDRHAFRFKGQHAFLYFLFRMYSPSQRQTLDSRLFGYDYSTLSKVFNVVCTWVDSTHKHRLNQLPNVQNKFQHFNDCIVQQLLDHFNLENIPEHAQHCSLFVDGVRFRCSRPSGPYWMQYAVFSGDKWFHNHGAQGVFAPDGMFYDWYDGPVGRHTDKYFFRESGVNSVLRDAQMNNPIQYWAYGDKGYSAYSHFKVAHHGPGYVSPAQRFENWLMARERVGIEWGYGKIKRRCPFVSKPHLLKLRGCDVAQYIRVAVILTNAHTCLRQSQCGLFFNCAAPDIFEYFE